MRERRRYDDDGFFRRRRWSFARSGWATGIALGIPLLCFGIAWHLHQRARFHQLTATVMPETTSAPKPGGQESILLSRVALLNDSEPEFVSATVLPGIGMQLLQTVVAFDEMQQNLLSSIPLSDVTRVPVESVNGAAFHVRVGTQHLRDASSGQDLIALSPSSGTQNQTLVDGGQATGNFHGNGTVADVKASVEITLSGREIDLVVHAENSGTANRYAVIEWSPRFALDAGRQPMLLTVPSRTVEQNGALHPVDGKSFDFTNASGSTIPNEAFDLRYVGLTHDFLSEGAFVRLQNNRGYYFRVLGMGDSLRSVRAQNDPAAHALLLGFSSLDPTADPERRDQTLRPGQALTWHLRMEVLPVATGSATEEAR